MGQEVRARNRWLILAASAALIVVAVVATTIRIHPYFGNMDDGGFLEVARTGGPLHFASTLTGGVDTGFFRTSSMLIVWPAYWLGTVAGPTWFFVTNAMVVFACVIAFAMAMRRLLAWPDVWPVLAFLAAATLWPFTAELFFFPSLSEKGIVLGAAALFWWSAESSRLRSGLAYWASLLVASAFAFTTKVHILVFIPAIILSIWLAPRTELSAFKARRALPATLLLMALSSILVVVALRAPYTHSTQGALGLDFASDRRFLGLLLITGLYVVAQSVRVFVGKQRSLDWVPATLLATMCGAFIVWDIQNYFLAIAGVMVGSAVATVVSWMRPSWRQIAVAAALTATAITWLVLRLPAVYSSLASIGAFLTSPAAAQLDAENATIYVSCLEAPDHYNRYAADIGLTGIQFAFLGDASPALDSVQKGDNTYVLADSRLCPWSPPSARWAPVWTTGDDRAYRLFGLNGP